MLATIFYSITIVGMFINTYLLILPALGIRKHWIRILIMLGIIMSCFLLVPLFFLPGIIMSLSLFALIKSEVKTELGTGTWVVIGIALLLPSPLMAMYIFAYMFTINDFSYYLALAFSPLWGIWAWTFLNKSRCNRQDSRLLHSLMLILIFLPPFVIWATGIILPSMDV